MLWLFQEFLNFGRKFGCSLPQRFNHCFLELGWLGSFEYQCVWRIPILSIGHSYSVGRMRVNHHAGGIEYATNSLYSIGMSACAALKTIFNSESVAMFA